MTTSNAQIKLSLPPAILLQLKVRAGRMDLTVNAYIRYLLIKFIDRVMWIEYVGSYQPDTVKEWSVSLGKLETFSTKLDSHRLRLDRQLEQAQRSTHTTPERHAWWLHPSTIRKKAMKKIMKQDRMEHLQKY